MIFRVIMDILFAVGVFFILSGVIGLFRMPDTYCRLQCAGNIVTMGCIPILAAMALFGFSTGNIAIGIKALFVIFFILVLYPVAIQALIKAAYKGGAKMDLRSKADDYGRDKANE